MVRRSRLTRAATLQLVCALVWPVFIAGHTSPASAAALPEGEDPLEVSIETLRPSVLPESGPVRITGTVTNVDDERWSTINLYAIFGAEPFVTSDALAEAAALDVDQFVGERILTAGTEDRVAELDPGEAAPFSLTVPRSELNTSAGEGVYWFGVHAIGQADSQGRDSTADGKARTFLPYIAPPRRRALNAPQVQVAVVVPLRREIEFTPAGKIADPEGWEKDLSPGSRLADLVEFGSASGDRPVNWLIDPALPDAVRRLAQGNPGRSIGPSPLQTDDEPEVGEEEPGEEPSPQSPTPGSPESAEPPEAEAESANPGDEATDAAEARGSTARTAARWTNRLRQVIADDEVLALPYGDLDVAAAAKRPDLIRAAERQPGRVLAEFGFPTALTHAPPAGLLSRRALGEIDPDARLILSDAAFEQAPGVAQIDGHTVAVSSDTAVQGGPGPDARFSLVNVRQRLLGEAATRFLTPGRPPLIAVVPPAWKELDGADFFTGLDVEWLELTSTAQATDRNGKVVAADDVLYPRFQRRRELEPDHLAVTEEVIDDGRVLQRILRDNDRVDAAIAEQALAASSYGARANPEAAKGRLRGMGAWVDRRLNQVRITAPSGVTLSGESGEFGATIENSLSQPITVSVAALTDDSVRVETPRMVNVEANSKTSINLTAELGDSRVHRVELVLTDLTGEPIAEPTSVPLRSAQFSGFIWGFLVIGIFLFGLRLATRVRAGLRSRGATASANQDGIASRASGAGGVGGADGTTDPVASR